MEKKIRKDKNLRKKYLLEEISKFILSYSANNILFNNNIRNKLYKERLDKIASQILGQQVRRCVSTGRKKRANKWFNFSRLALSRYVRTKKILHWKKSKW